MFVLNRFKKFHFVGIGGAGMSALADLLVQHGCEVAGSDAVPGGVTTELAHKGVHIFEGHHRDHVHDPDVVVISSAIDSQNPELLRAYELDIPVIKRAELLGQLFRFYFGIGVAGTHGKTTTTAMVCRVLEVGGLDPLAVVGGAMKNYSANVRIGRGPYFVTEADEYDKSFLQLHPCIAVVTSLEPDHLECYQTVDNLEAAFAEFCNRVPFFGRQILCADDAGVRRLMDRLDGAFMTYGLNDTAQLIARHIQPGEVQTRFEVWLEDDRLGEITLRVPGRHNVQNALAAIAVGLESQIDFAHIARGLADFGGIQRRLEIKGTSNNVLIIDDYAHHPTEMLASLAALRATYNRRIVLIFQPHLYSRTAFFQDEFGDALQQADRAFVTDVYPAREKPIPGVTGELLVNLARDKGHQSIDYIPALDEVVTLVKPELMPGDIVVTMGAGDVTRVAPQLLTALST